MVPPFIILAHFINLLNYLTKLCCRDMVRDTKSRPTHFNSIHARSMATEIRNGDAHCHAHDRPRVLVCVCVKKVGVDVRDKCSVIVTLSNICTSIYKFFGNGHHNS